MNIYKQLVNLSLVALMACTISGCNSQQEKEVRRMFGQVVHTEGDSMLVVVAGNDTISMHRTDVKTEMPFVMDSVVLYYVMDHSGKMYLEDLIILNHNQPVLNNVTAMLIGTWQIDDEESELRQISFDDTLNAQVVKKSGNSNNVSWLLKGKNVIYGSGVPSLSNAEQYQVVSVDANTLKVVNDMAEYTLRRFYN